MTRAILWIVPKWPFPAQDGARIATTSLIKQLATQGETIDLLAIAAAGDSIDTGQAVQSLGLRNAYAIRRKAEPSFAPLRLLGKCLAFFTTPHIPITMQPYSAAHVRRLMAKILKGQILAGEIECAHIPNPQPPGWDVIVYDGLHPAIHSSLVGKFMRPSQSKRIVYRAHNCESALWERKVALTSATAERILLAHQSSIVKIFEESVVRNVDGVAAMSPEDLAAFQKMKRSLKGGVIPIGCDFAEPAAYAPQAKCQVMFVGRLDWPPNREGLVWFLEKVWPSVAAKRPDLWLAIAGSGDCAWIQPFCSLPNVDFLGNLPNLNALYEASFLSLVPIFYGGGTRVKAIEAARFGRACLSTALGVEGIGLEEDRSYFQAESAADWTSRLINLKPDEALAAGRNAHESLRQKFDAAHTARQFSTFLDQVCEG